MATTSRLNINKFIKDRSAKNGLAPGSLIHVGSKKIDHVEIDLIDYSENHFEEKKLDSVRDSLHLKNNPTVTWVNIEGLEDTDTIKAIGEYFGSNLLILEDMLNTDQRPKIEIFDDYIFIVFKMLSYNDNLDQINTEQVSIVFGKDYLISLQEGIEGDVFEPVRNRLRKGSNYIRKKGADFLAYTLLDVVIDNYFDVLEKIGEKMEALDEQLINNPRPEILQEVYNLKREVIFMRKSIWPMREIVNRFEQVESEIVCQTTRAYLRDIYDHIIQVIDTEETFRDIISGMMDLYLSSISNRMNEIMKFLSIVGTIFIPLTFIVGLYGMNFEYMPELKSKYGYPTVLVVMILVSISMIIFFKKKKWL